MKKRRNESIHSRNKQVQAAAKRKRRLKRKAKFAAALMMKLKPLLARLGQLQHQVNTLTKDNSNEIDPSKDSRAI